MIIMDDYDNFNPRGFTPLSYAIWIAMQYGL